ncbi:SpoIID/LytB domain-containing protein [bacterium]|nr:SpoIID/LytB domain-containing protein [bacterium]
MTLNSLVAGGESKNLEEDMARTKSGDSESSSRRKVERIRKKELVGQDPTVRVGLMEEYDRIDFNVLDEYDLVTLSGEAIETGLRNDTRWHVVPDRTQEARAIYSILTTAFAKRDAADKLRRSLSQKNHPSRVVEVGEEVSIDGRLVANNIKYRVLVGRWSTEREARQHIDEFRENFAPRIVRQIVKPASGTIEIFNSDYTKSIMVDDGFKIMPKNPQAVVKLFDVREGTGFHWEREVDRIYPGVIEVCVDHRGMLMAITELPLELYLKGVVPAEMSSNYPLDALKAQAVAARSEVLSKIGLKHPNDPFDLCAHVHCQAYSGCSHYAERASQAVDETLGQVLMLDNRVAEAVYSACCGGHTEDKVNVWNPPDAAHLKGKWDASEDADLPTNLDLSKELDIEKWISARPDVWCNTSNHMELPDILYNADRHFRWEVVYSRRELEEIIRRKSGEDIGNLVDIVPLQRGNSGRLMEIEILGTLKNLKVQRELNIRNILSHKYLESACFTVEVEDGADGRPINFILHGAGWGHGVGMCQVGAGVMASKGKTYKEILTHYYPGTRIEKIYGKNAQEDE